MSILQDSKEHSDLGLNTLLEEDEENKGITQAAASKESRDASPMQEEASVMSSTVPGDIVETLTDSLVKGDATASASSNWSHSQDDESA